MCKRGDLVQSIPVAHGIAVAIYRDSGSGQWTAVANIPTPVGSVEVSATAREDVVNAAILAARQLWCRLMGLGNCDPTDVFLDPGPKVGAATMAAQKVATTVVRVARAASLLHRARMGDPSAQTGVNDVVVTAKNGNPESMQAWKIMQTLAGLANVAKAWVPHEVDPRAYDTMVSGYHSGQMPTLDMIAGADGAYRVRRSSSGAPNMWQGPSSSAPKDRAMFVGGGRYGLAMRW